MSENRLKVTINGPLKDLWRFTAHITTRNRIFRRTSADRPVERHSIKLKEAIHPERQNLIVDKIHNENGSTRSYTLIPDPAQSESSTIAAFRAGQYLSIEVTLESGKKIRRPYSISNTPEEARRDNAYIITVKTGNEAFIPEEMNKNWAVGTTLTSSDPWGQFYIEPLRDPLHLVFIAGGTGVTPFRSMVDDTLSKYEDSGVVLVQGAENTEDLLFRDYFMQLIRKYPQRFRWIPVLSGNLDPDPSFNHDIQTGFIDAQIIYEAAGEQDCGYFICGPGAMHDFVSGELKNNKIRPQRIRREDYGIPGKPAGRKPVEISVRMADESYQVSADRDETVLVALERAGLNPPSRCRTGSCGWCRSSLIEGQIRYEKEPDGLRAADRDMGYFHPCAAKPESNLVIDIPGNPGKGEL